MWVGGGNTGVWSHSDITNEILSDKITPRLHGFNFLRIPCVVYRVLCKLMNTYISPFGSVSLLVAKCICSQFCPQSQTRNFKYPDLLAASLMIVDVNHNKSKKHWEPEVFYESSKEEKSIFWPILVMKLWFSWFIHLTNTYCVQGIC